jgi:hypothetical protein
MITDGSEGERRAGLMEGAAAGQEPLASPPPRSGPPPARGRRCEIGRVGGRSLPLYQLYRYPLSQNELWNRFGAATFCSTLSTV